MSDATPMHAPFCAACRWWRDEGERDAGLQTYNLYLRDPETYERLPDDAPGNFPVRLCTSPKLRRRERPAPDGAAVLDGSNYAAGLATGPAFGCIHWEGA